MSFVSRVDPSAVSQSRPVVGVRVALARHRWWRIAAVLVLALVAGAAHRAVVGDAERERDAWGTTIEVWVASGPHEPGDDLRADRSVRPVAIVPPEAVADDPTGRVAYQRIAAGEIVVEADLAPSVSPLAVAPAGSVVVPVADPLVADAAVGARVAVASEGVVLAATGTVVRVADRVVFVAVAADDAPMVAAAAGRSMASLLFPAEPHETEPP